MCHESDYIRSMKLKLSVFLLTTLLLLLREYSLSANCDSTSKGYTPFIDLGTGTYQGFEGGLYPGGSNFRPSAHNSVGLNLGWSIRPLNNSGQPDSLGKIVLISIGMSNCSQEFSTFIPLANADTSKNPDLLIINGAQGGQTAAIIQESTAFFWDTVDARLSHAGVTPLQVQIAWLKEANANPTAPFPTHAETLQAQLAQITRVAKNRYPNLKIIYLASRTYAGYASTTLNPEPYAYESGFSVKWLIEEQINGEPRLNYDSAQGQVFSPWLSWGPYLWADGINPRSDSLIWLCSNFSASDGTHPSATGRIKVANLLLDFFKSESTSLPWFKKDIYILGDANRDRLITLSDVIFLVNYIFKGGLYPYPFQAGDPNCSDSITLADVIYLVNYLLKSGPAPCSP